MSSPQKLRKVFLVLGPLVLLGMFVVHLLVGKQSAPASEVFTILFGGEAAEARWQTIIVDFRIPRAITAVLAGAALSISGLIMQSFFRNALAGPYVLGISSGANLGVAILVLTGSLMSASMGVLSGTWGIAIASVLGSFLVLLLVMAVASRVKDTVTLLIVGLMFASITGAAVGVLEFFSTPELIDAYLNWTFGSTGGVTWKHLSLLVPLLCGGLFLSVFLMKGLNAWLLGENYAQSMGVNIKRVKWLSIIVTSLLAGGVTAFCGPIAFLGLAVPHLSRGLLNTTNHRILWPFTALLGASLMLGCDILSDLPWMDKSLPLNSVMALVGAPVVIAVILKRRKMKGVF